MSRAPTRPPDSVLKTVAKVGLKLVNGGLRRIVRWQLARKARR